MISSLCIGLIRLYQLTIRPLIGPCCRFYPSCSEYAIQAFKIHPIHKAFGLTICRIARCSGLSKGGVDEVPKPCLPDTSGKEQSSSY